MEDQIEGLKKRISSIKEVLELDSKIEQKENLQKESLEKNFWENQNKAKDIMQKINEINELASQISSLEKSIENLNEYSKVATKSDTEDVQSEYKKINDKLAKFELNQFLSGKYDKSGAILSIHSGQGGTEANDWTQILLRMYSRYAESQDWTVEEIHKVKCEEAGLSTVSIEIKGEYAYGYLKNEAGTHRLVRLSPFNAQNLRQTSFAGVEVLPIIKTANVDDIEINDKDVEFKATRAGGPGGQHVNKTSTAVTLTHIPTGITVQSSSRRSQFQNREAAMSLLKAKLWAIKEKELEKEKKQLKGKHKVAAWGNQIRNYVLHPYKLVKDLRTKVESKHPEEILDGKLDEFIKEEIKL